MKVLLDTHVLIWWMENSARLSKPARRIIENPENHILISAAVGWELAIKVAAGKIRPASLLDQLRLLLEKETFTELAMTVTMAVRAGSLPPHHRDPFDRMLVAQSQLLEVPILSTDGVLDLYDVKRLW